jgi:7,8-dihydroneopterin aldolase/epimerase/oxygenase
VITRNPANLPPGFSPSGHSLVPECIIIRSLELQCHIGVPPEERSQKQTLLLDLELQPLCDFVRMEDEIERTVDYAKLANELVDLAASRPRKLIETLASDLAMWTFRHHPVVALTLRIRKFILPNTEFVGVRLAWRREDFENFVQSAT